MMTPRTATVSAHSDAQTSGTGIPLRMNAVQWGLLLVLSLIWGGSFFFNAILLRDLPPLTLVLGRTSIAALALFLYARAQGKVMPASATRWREFFIMGLLNNLIPFLLIVWSQQYISSGLASVLNATTPLFSVILVHVLTGEERITWLRMAGVLLGIAGVALLMGDSLPGSRQGPPWAPLAVLGAACSYALAGIYGRRFRGLDPIVPATGMLTTAAITVAPLALYIDRPWTVAMAASGWLALLGLALLSTAVAYLIFFRLLASAGPTNAMLVTFLIPPSAVGLGLLFLGERLTAGMMAGMLLIFLGLLAVDGRLLRRR